VATWGNLANRVLSFTFKHWEGHVPEPGELTAQDETLLRTVEAGFESVAAEMEAVHLRGALAEAMRLATEVNKYLDVTAPWTAIKTDREAAARSIYTALCAINALKIYLAPFLPHTAQKLHEYLGLDGSLFGTQSTTAINDTLGEHTVLRYHGETAVGRWEAVRLQPGHALRQPAPLFKKLDIKIVEEERARLGQPRE